ncbi:hypothetical protein BT96DRAFT_974443 [Gymnopus androsaceus JB14]|uniref:LysM domain-containing protein n=1 Tax=Gymnopus androsaceus JB14 TaxID=1447944 RepID=A0A6A4HWC5_9AGAR|nr:hypothetical protein BT96DRAFT_974443 [Gymnopus androsaceus JB14]
MFANVAIAAFVLPFFVQSAVAQCTRSYTIPENITCDGISAAESVSTYQLATVNAGIINSECSNLEPGTTICLGYASQDCNTTYVVVANDTCDSITTANGINSTLLYGNNPQINSACSNIYVGEVLCVANTIAAPPAGSSLNTAIPSTATAAVSAASSASVSAPGSSLDTAIPSTATAAASASSASSTSVYTTSETTTTAAAASTSAANDDDDDDSDLPYCDEL